MEKKEFRHTRVYTRKKYEIEKDFINKKFDENLCAEEIIYFFC